MRFLAHRPPSFILYGLHLHGGSRQEKFEEHGASTCRHHRGGTHRYQCQTVYPYLTPFPQDHHSLASYHNGRIFKPLPPIPKISSLHFSFVLDLPTDSPSIADISSPIFTQNLALHDSSIDATDGNHVGSSVGAAEVPESPEAIYFSTDPYSPWPSPVRRRFMPRSDSSFSHVSRYSRPESRSGARAPDPPSRPTSIGTVRWNFPVVRRVRRFTRNVSLFARRIHTLKTVLRKVHCREPVITRPPTPQLPRRMSARVSRSSSATSFMQNQSLRRSISSALSTSLQRWLETRNQLAYEKSSGHVSITISQYERKGSWLTDDWCGIQHCDIHSSPPQSPRGLITDRSVTSICTESFTGRYVSVSLKAGEEALRRRKRSSDRTVTWSSSELSAESLEDR